MKYIITAFKAVLLIIVVLFSVFNMGLVQLTVFPDRISFATPLFLPILIAVILGVIFASVFFYADKWKFAREAKQLKRELKMKEEELQRLRNLPLMENEQESSDK